MSQSAHAVAVVGTLDAGDPEPPVGTTVEVGSIPLPRAGCSGDLLTFTRLDTGWVKQHNRGPQQEHVDYESVQYWAPLRILGIGEQHSNVQRHRPRHLAAVASQ
jgi:hypothetical protein